MADAVPPQYRILIADDEREIRDEYAHVLGRRQEETETRKKTADLETELFGTAEGSDVPSDGRAPDYDLTQCSQGGEAVEAVRAGVKNHRPYSVAFLDVRMPPGIDGVEAAAQIREIDPFVNIVIVTGYSDAHPEEITRRVPPTDKILYCQKPVHSMELAQFANALSAKWKTEHELTGAKERLRQLLTSSPAVIYSREPAERQATTYVSENVRHEFDYDPIDLVGDPDFWTKHIHPDDLEQVIRDKAEIHTAGIIVSRYRLKQPNGSYRWVRDDARLACDSHGDPIEIVGSLIDITDRVKAQEEMRQIHDERDEALAKFHEAQKHESLGTLAAGVAHDFNNILGIMNGYAHLAIEDLPDDSTQRKMLEGILRAGERGAALVDQILAYTRSDENTDAIVRLDRSASECLKMLRSTLPATIQLVIQIPDLQAYVRADETQIHQLMSNLCINAAHSIGNAPGTIEISCQVEKVSQEGAAKVRPALDAKSADATTVEKRPDGQGGKLWFGSLSAGDHVRLTVKDDGCGIDGDTLDRILEPFFSTKDVGEGTGLGLAAVTGIIRSCRGAFVIETKVGQGTRFDVYFPVVEEGAASSEIEVSDLRGTQRILLVEDAPKLRREAAAVLSDLGYQVTSLADGASALKAFEKAPGDWDLIITDQALRMLSGIDLARKILELKADMPIVMLSGAAQKMLQADVKALGITEFHEKPLDATDLARLVRRLFDTAVPTQTTA